MKPEPGPSSEQGPSELYPSQQPHALPVTIGRRDNPRRIPPFAQGAYRG